MQRSPGRRPLATLVIALAATAALVAGCGGGDEEPTPSGSPQASQAAGGAGTQTLLDAQQLTVLDQQIVYPKKKKSAQVSSYIVTLEPGQETGWHRHRTPMYAYVMEGTITVEYDAGVTKEFPQGTALMQAEDVWHNGTNMGDSTVRMLTVFMGANGAKNTVERTP